MAPRKEFPDFPRAVQHNWHWVAALYAWDRDDPEPLQDCLANQAPPEELQPSIEKRLNGSVRPNKKSAVKLKLPPADRMWLAAHYSVQIYLHSKGNETVGIYPDGRRFLEARADELRIEPVELKRQMQNHQRLSQENVADQFGLSVETLENILRDMGRLARAYPDL